MFRYVVEKVDFDRISESKDNIQYLPLFLRYMVKNEFKSEKSKEFIEKSVKLIKSVVKADEEPDSMWLG